MESNHQPELYESPALPLSYIGIRRTPSEIEGRNRCSTDCLAPSAFRIGAPSDRVPLRWFLGTRSARGELRQQTYKIKWCREPDLHWRRRAFQARALLPELSRQRKFSTILSNLMLVSIISSFMLMMC